MPAKDNLTSEQKGKLQKALKKTRVAKWTGETLTGGQGDKETRRQGDKGDGKGGGDGEDFSMNNEHPAPFGGVATNYQQCPIPLR